MTIRFNYIFLLVAISALIADNLLFLDNHYFILIVAVITSIPIIQSLIEVVRTGVFSVDLLASVAIAASFYAGELISVIVINMMVISAKIFSEYTKQKTTDALNKLVKLRPTIARVKRKNQVKEIPIKQVRVGDILIVITGEKIPVDGRVQVGNAAVNQSSLTGESIPVEKNTGDQVFAATIVASGEMEICAEKIGDDTSFEKVVQLVVKASNNRSNIDNLGQTFTKLYILIILIAAPVIYYFTHNLSIVIAILLVVCADDLAVAIPLAYVAGLGTAAKYGIIVKGANFMERMRSIKHLVLDKTGTITKGIPEVAKVNFIKTKPSKNTWKYLSAVNMYSQHPISKAIFAYSSHKAGSYNPDKYDLQSGQGIRAMCKKRILHIGSVKFFANQKISIGSEIKTQISKFQSKGFNVTLFAIDKKITALICLEDKIKPGVYRTIQNLYQNGIKHITILTGDNQMVAQRIAKVAGIKDFHAGLLPEEKVNYIKQFQQTGKVAMIGDGVNDAPSFVTADLSIAMGAIGSDVAIDSANIVLMDDQIEKIPILLQLSHDLHRVVLLNIVIWIVVNIFGIYLVFAGYLHPTGAATYNFVMDFFPILNSMRLIFWRFKQG